MVALVGAGAGVGVGVGVGVAAVPACPAVLVPVPVAAAAFTCFTSTVNIRIKVAQHPVAVSTATFSSCIRARSSFSAAHGTGRPPLLLSSAESVAGGMQSNAYEARTANCASYLVV